MNIAHVGIFVFWWMVVYADECPYQVCTCDPIQILCQSKGLHAIPPLTKWTNSTYQLLFLDANHITTIANGSLLPNLTEISLLNNPLVTIEDQAFIESAGTLETLTFSKTLFTRIPNALLHLKVLKYFSIQDTIIQDWNEDVMLNIGPSVNTLYLGNVGLTSWPSWTKYFINLTELSIIQSNISYLPANAVETFASNLQKLSLIGNNLTSIPKSLSQLRVLQSLNLQATDIAELSGLPQSTMLSILNLANNNLSDANQVSSSLQQLAGSLKFVDLQENYLTFLPDLSKFINLEQINLNHNKISDTNNGSLPDSLRNLNLAFNSLPGTPTCLSHLQKLSYLDLPRNSLKTIRGIDFPPLTMIADFGYNLITELTDTSFPSSSSLNILTFNNNPIVSISNLAFRNLPDLSFLNLQFTKLTRLPLALSSLTRLSRLDISGNVDLVCTCLEKTLKPVLSNISNLVGNCGQASVEYFFDNLIVSCPDS